MIIKRIKNIQNFGFPLLLSAFFSISILYSSRDNSLFHFRNKHLTPDSEIVFLYLPFKDTFYYLGKQYIEINLSKQIAVLVTRDGKNDTVKISSGNKYLHKAIETPTGFFAVQNKAPIQISRQFENTEMLNWIGFNGNIGFHGLKKTGYYAHLGRKPSSHGCVRMSNEDGERWYKIVKIGTPVLVFKDNPVRVIKFANYSEVNYYRDLIIKKGNSSTVKILNKRIRDISSGHYYRFNNFKIFIDEKVSLTNSNIVAEEDNFIMPFQLPSLWKSKPISLSKVSSLVWMDLMNVTDTCKVSKFDKWKNSSK